jgi:hypothetical protein
LSEVWLLNFLRLYIYVQIDQNYIMYTLRTYFYMHITHGYTLNPKEPWGFKPSSRQSYGSFFWSRQYISKDEII